MRLCCYQISKRFLDYNEVAPRESARLARDSIFGAKTQMPCSNHLPMLSSPSTVCATVNRRISAFRQVFAPTSQAHLLNSRNQFGAHLDYTLEVDI